MNKTALKKSLINLIGCFVIVVCSSDLQAASFDCLKAATNVEKLICSDPAISQLDSDLGAAYRTALDKAANKDVLKQEQRQWLKTKLNICKDVDCLSNAYSQRIAELNASQFLANNSPEPTKTKFTLKKGKQFQLCSDFLDLMNRVPKKEKPNCGLDYPFDEIAKKQGFKEIEWKEVDLKNYKEIFKNHSVYRKKDQTAEEIRKNEQEFDAYFATSTARIWTASFDANGDKNKDTVIRIKYKNCAEGSPEEVFLIRNDGVLDEKAYARKFTNEFFMYQGKAYFHYSIFIGEMVGQDTYGYHKSLCQFE